MTDAYVVHDCPHSIPALGTAPALLTDKHPSEHERGVIRESDFDALLVHEDGVGDSRQRPLPTWGER